MKVITTGEIYDIYSDTLQTFDQLPAQAYVVRCAEQKGFYLQKFTDIEVNEKIYGVHISKVEKVLNAFNNFQRNLGVILSGDKGIGKSLFAKILSVESIKRGIPLIIVDRYYRGVASYLDSIRQEVVVLFDEFDKTFGEVRAGDDCASPQAELLTLFDGVSTGKKLYVITCNNLNKLNDFLVNRPGRFHYHFRFNYPTPAEIEEYMKDKIPEEMYGEIVDIIDFSQKVDLNYDCLRAIAFEISNGYKFKDAIADLNIINLDSQQTYNVTVHYSNGTALCAKNVFIDMFNEDRTEYRMWVSDQTRNEIAVIRFDVTDATYSADVGCYVIPGGEITIDYESDEEDDDFTKVVKEYKQLSVQCLTIKRRPSKNIHYAV